MPSDTQKIIRQISDKSSDPQLIESAFEFAKEAYKDKYRISGENYIVHATRVALELGKMDLDPSTIALGLLHDVLDDTPGFTKKVELKEIEKKFGKDLSQMIEKISNISKVQYSLSLGLKDKKTLTKEKIENLRRMFLALAGDLRVVLVELVSRQDGLNFLDSLPEDQQKLFALETLQIFVPVASRLGLSGIRRNLEDTAFSFLFPAKFKWLKENIKEQFEEREKYLKKFIPHLKKIFKKERVKVLDINYRAKSYWSTYQKLLRHGMNFDEIYDLLALRIITSDIESCYKILGVVHKHFKPISDEINDYIAHPKLNGYRSLHTTIFSEGNKTTEVQIRTEEMHKEAEYGVCAHWSYKEKIDLKKEGENFEWVKDVSDFWKNFKIDFFPSKVFCFTPMGDVIVLPKDSTPVDFAYAVHSDVGNHCESAKIGGKIVQLNHILENGDTVEIVTSKNKIPSKDWLRFVKTSLARSHINRLTDQKSNFQFPLPNFIKRKIAEISEASKKRQEEKQNVKKGNVKQIYLSGQQGMLIHIAKCCNPKPGDKVSAYLAQSRSAVLHKISCNNFKKISEKYPEKVIDASWE
ncbi:MAG: HD domain-containing protein [Candidatus Staskawiczbacteria bacterium]|nr:HD domain-containing protein [Candidatus Staskawiczbacteria bacterium]